MRQSVAPAWPYNRIVFIAVSVITTITLITTLSAARIKKHSPKTTVLRSPSLKQESVTIGPRIWLQDNQPLNVVHHGDAQTLAVLRSGQAEPLAMAKSDFDAHGVDDPVIGYAAPSAGVLAIHRGNLDAFAPQSDTSFSAIGANGTMIIKHESRQAMNALRAFAIRSRRTIG